MSTRSTAAYALVVGIVLGFGVRVVMDAPPVSAGSQIHTYRCVSDISTDVISITMHNPSASKVKGKYLTRNIGGTQVSSGEVTVDPHATAQRGFLYSQGNAEFELRTAATLLLNGEQGTADGVRSIRCF